MFVGKVVKSRMLSAANEVLFDRYFAYDGDELVFSERGEGKDDFFSKHPKSVISGHAVLYDKRSKSDSFVDFFIDDSGDKKTLFSKYLDKIKEVLSALKERFGFRFDVIIKINGMYIRDKDLYNRPMNIGHVLKNPNPVTEVAHKGISRIVKEGQSEEDNKKRNVALRMTDSGVLEISPRQYVYPIDVPIPVDNSSYSDNYSNRVLYKVKAVEPTGGAVDEYYFVATPEQVGMVVPYIQEYMQRYSRGWHPGFQQNVSSMGNNISNVASVKAKRLANNTKIEAIRTSRGNIYMSKYASYLRGMGDIKFDTQLGLWWVLDDKYNK